VQRVTALCLTQALEKYELVLRTFRQVEDALEEEEGEGRWKTRRQEVEREIKKKVPNFEVIVAFSQVKSTVDSSVSQWGATDLVESDKVLKNAMLAECALRLMWLYHRSLPEMPSEARYDVGKLLLSGSGRRLVDSLGNSTSPVIVTSEAPHDVAGFDVLSQLHILRLLQHSDQFIWHATLGASSFALLRIWAN
jgi:nucleolar pre-ribosomal-associated protein 1